MIRGTQENHSFYDDFGDYLGVKFFLLNDEDFFFLKDSHKNDPLIKINE